MIPGETRDILRRPEYPVCPPLANPPQPSPLAISPRPTDSRSGLYSRHDLQTGPVQHASSVNFYS
jgi:hypothetical protein